MCEVWISFKDLDLKLPFNRKQLGTVRLSKENDELETEAYRKSHANMSLVNLQCGDVKE